MLTPGNDKTKAGRPIKIDFRELKPGERLTVPSEGDPEQVRRLQKSVSNFKTRNFLDWKCCVFQEGKNIIISRLK